MCGDLQQKDSKNVAGALKFDSTCDGFVIKLLQVLIKIKLISHRCAGLKNSCTVVLFYGDIAMFHYHRADFGAIEGTVVFVFQQISYSSYS